MKIIISTFLLFTCFSGLALAQPEGWRKGEMKDRFDQLEKIKLIETLEMDEETTLRFFARKSEHENEQEQFQDEIRSNIEDLDVIFKSGRVATVEEIKFKIDRINEMHTQLAANRTAFINSLSDILSYEQIARLLIFERKFREEIRRLIMKDHKPPRDRE